MFICSLFYGVECQQSIGVDLQSLPDGLPSGKENSSVESIEFGAVVTATHPNGRSHHGHMGRYRRSYHHYQTLSGFRSPPASCWRCTTYRLYLLQVNTALILT